MVDVAIIGCGVVGAAAAMQLARRRCSVLVLEAENDVAMGTTKANSAILHAGYDPEPGTLMAKLNLRGSLLAAELCEQLDVPRRQCGSMVLAFSEEEREHLRVLLERGQKNGVPGLHIVSGEEARRMEPVLSPEVRGALVAPTAAIVSPWELALAMAENAVQNGAQLLLETPVTGLSPVAGGWRLDTPRGSYTARFVLNAAGALVVGGKAGDFRDGVQLAREIIESGRAEEKLAEVDIQWDEGASACVVMASGGYPGSYPKGLEITGLDENGQAAGATVYHAGTKYEDGRFLTNGGRVLGVTALGATLEEALDKAYAAVGTISFEGAMYRKDIGRTHPKG